MLASLLGSVGPILSSFMMSNAYNKASDQQSAAAANQLGFQRKVYGDIQQQEHPFVNVGQGAVNQLGALFGIPGAKGAAPGVANYSQFFNSPDYNFAQQQGNLALQRQGAAAGGLLSGGQLKAGEQFGQGLASQQFGNYFSRLLGLSTIGANAAANVGTAENNLASTSAGTGIFQGKSQAMGTLGSANAWASLPNNMLSGMQSAYDINHQPGSQSGMNNLFGMFGGQ